MLGTIILWTLLGLLCLILLLLVAPVVAHAEARGGDVLVRVRVLGVPFTLLPIKEKPAKPQKPPKEGIKKKQETPLKPQRPRTWRDWLRLGITVAKSAGEASKFFLRFMLVRGVEIVLPVSGADAAETALNFGRAQAALGALRAVLENLFNIRFKQLRVIPDFTGQIGQDTAIFSCKIIASPAIMILAGIFGFKRFFSLMAAARKARRRSGYRPASPASDKKANTGGVSADVPPQSGNAP